MKKKRNTLKRILVLIMIGVFLVGDNSAMVYATSTGEEAVTSEAATLPEETETTVPEETTAPEETASTEETTAPEEAAVAEEAPAAVAEEALAASPQPRTLLPAQLPATWETDLVTLIPDPVFRAVVKAACESTMTGDYSGGTTEDVLAAFNNNGARLYVTGAVTNIEGAQLLTGLTEIRFDTTVLQDISNLYSYRYQLGPTLVFVDAPIHIWPTGLADSTDVNMLGNVRRTQHNFNVAYYNVAEATYVHNDSAKRVDLVAGLYAGATPMLDKAEIYEAIPGLSEPDNWGKTPERYIIRLTDEVSESMGILAEFFPVVYYSGTVGWNRQRADVSYNYQLDTEYYSTLKFIPNNIVLSGFTFTKTNDDSANVKKLEGAIYEVYTDAAFTTRAQQAVVADDGSVSWVNVPLMTTDENGQFTVENLKTGTYYLKEMSAPFGYQINSAPVSVDVTADAVNQGLDTTSGEGTSLTVTADTAEFKTPDAWTGSALDEVEGQTMTTTDVATKSVADYSADLFIKNGGTNVGAISSVPTGFVSLKAPKYVVKNTKDNSEVGTYGTLAAAVASVNDMINNNGLEYNYVIEETETIYYDSIKAGGTATKAKNKLLPIHVKLGAKKTLRGGDLATSDPFTFELKDSAGGVLQTATNNAAGEIVFATPLKFDTAGIYTYTLSEQMPISPNPNMIYDTTARTVEIKVDDVDENRPVSIGASSQRYQGFKATISVDGTKVATLYADRTTEQDESAKVNLTPINATTFGNSMDPIIRKESDRDGETLETGDSIIYTLTLENPLDVQVSVEAIDDLPDQVKVVDWSIDGQVQNTTWTGSKSVDIPAAGGAVGKTVIVLNCEVTAKFDKDSVNQYENVISNQASMEYNGKISYTTIHTSYLQPTVEYTMEKERTNLAPEFGSTGTYGFKPEEVGEYAITIKNTGELALTMTADDIFDTPGNSNFENVVFVGVTNPAGGVLDPADATTNFVDGMDAQTGMSLTIQPDKEVVVLVEATVTSNAVYSLDDTAEDTDNNTHGYQNTATVKDISSEQYEKIADVTYDVASSGEMIGITSVTSSPANFTSGEANTKIPVKSDTAHTPIQPRVKYTMTKERTTDAPAKDGKPGFGFRRAEEVVYEIRIKNESPLNLTTIVNDTFGEQASYFENLRYIGVQSADPAGAPTDVLWNNKVQSENRSVPPNITIMPGVEAVVTVSATVSNTALELLSDTAADDGKGYLNIASTTEVKAEYTHPAGENRSADASELPELADQEDRANTPVQVKHHLMIDNITINPQDNTTTDVGGTVQENQSGILTEDNDKLDYELEETTVKFGPYVDQGWRHADTFAVYEYDNDTAANAQNHSNATKSTVIDLSPYKDINGLFTANGITEFQDELRNTYEDALVTIDADQVVTIELTQDSSGMKEYTEVDVAYVPTLWMENTTKDETGTQTYEGGTVKVVDGQNDASNMNSGDHQTERDVEKTETYATPEENWYALADQVYISSMGGTQHTIVPDANGDFTQTIEVDANGDGSPESVEVKGRISKAGDSVSVVLDSLPVPIDVGIPFAQKPLPGYRMEKKRVSEAPLKDKTSEYGFKLGDTVTYEVNVENTGATNLTLDLKDEFENSDYFKDITYVSATVDGVNAATNTLPATDKATIQVESGKTCTVTITAVVTDKAAEKLANQATDDKASSEDGYRNTATANNVVSTWTKSDGEVVVNTVLDYPVLLGERTDTADTPVQLPEKESEAPKDPTDPTDPTDPSSVKTGDNTMIALYVIVGLLSLSLIVYLVYRKKKKSKVTTN